MVWPHALARHFQAQVIQARERAQVRAIKDSIGHVEVFQMDGVAISIIGRPRPLPGHDTPNALTPPLHPQMRRADKVSQLLELESQSLKDFEAKMHEAMTRFTGTEYENQLKFKSVKADEQVQAIRAEHQTQFSALLHSILSPIEDMTSRADGSSEPLIGPSALDSSNTGATSNTAPATQGAQPEV